MFLPAGLAAPTYFCFCVSFENVHLLNKSVYMRSPPITVFPINFAQVDHSFAVWLGELGGRQQNRLYPKKIYQSMISIG